LNLSILLLFMSPESLVDDDTASRILGHSTAKSGAYIQKRTDLRSFGLIEPRGAIKLTELGRRVSYPENAKEGQEGLIQALQNIELWKLIYDKYTKKGITPPADFWTDIRALTGLAPEKAQNIAEIVRKDYLEDIRYIRPEFEPEKEEKPMETGKIDRNEAMAEGVIGRVTLSGAGHIDVKDEVTYTLAEAYLRVFAEKLRIKKKPKEES